MAHIRMCHDTHTNESRNTYEWAKYCSASITFYCDRWVMAHIWMSRGTQMNEPNTAAHQSRNIAINLARLKLHIWSGLFCKEALKTERSCPKETQSDLIQSPQLQHTATHCHTPTHCNTLQHTATHWHSIWLTTKLTVSGLFCKEALKKERSCSKENALFFELTNRIRVWHNSCVNESVYVCDMTHESMSHGHAPIHACLSRVC